MFKIRVCSVALSCKLRFARISARLRFQDRAECVLVLVFYIAKIAATSMFLKLSILSEHIIHCCSAWNIFTHAYWLIQGYGFCTVRKLGFFSINTVLMYVEWDRNAHTIITDDVWYEQQEQQKNNKNKICNASMCTERSWCEPMSPWRSQLG